MSDRFKHIFLLLSCSILTAVAAYVGYFFWNEVIHDVYTLQNTSQLNSQTPVRVLRPSYLTGSPKEHNYLADFPPKSLYLATLPKIKKITTSSASSIPAIVNPAIVNPAIVNPAIMNPAIMNPAIVNPAIVNPAIVNPPVVKNLPVQNMRVDVLDNDARKEEIAREQSPTYFGDLSKKNTVVSTHNEKPFAETTPAQKPFVQNGNPANNAHKNNLVQNKTAASSIIEEQKSSYSYTEKTRGTPHNSFFSEKTFHQSLIPNFRTPASLFYIKLKQQMNRDTFIGGVSDMSIFGFANNPQQLDLMERLYQQIQDEYGEISTTAKVSLSIHGAIFDAIKERMINPDDLFFSEGGIRLTQTKEPYPFMVLRLHDMKQGENIHYFQNKKDKDRFIGSVKKAFQRRSLHDDSTRSLASQVRIHDEGEFLYIRYKNIISHVIRLNARKEKIKPYDTLQTGQFHYTLIIDDVGENFALARAFMNLPFPMVYAIWPHSSYGTILATIAHEKGFPVFLHQPMQALSKGRYVPNMGKGGLKTEMSEEEFTAVLKNNLLFVPYVRGVNNHMGSRLTTNADAVDTFLTVMKTIHPNSLILDSVTHPDSLLYDKAKNAGFVTHKRDIFLDEVNTISHVLMQLRRSFAIGKRKGNVFVIGHARINTLKALRQWWQYQDDNIIFALPAVDIGEK